MSILSSAPDSELPVMPAVRKILATRTVASCHAALAEAANLLQTITLRPIDLVGEVTLGPKDQAALVWRRGDLFGQSAGVPVAFQEWFAHARGRPGQFCAFDDAVTGLVATGGIEEIPLYIVFLTECEPEESAPLETALRDIAGVAAQQLHRLRKDEETRLLRERSEARGASHAELLRASADLLWEADAEGVLHVTQIFNNRGDLARRFEGRSLREMTVADGKTVAAMAAHSKTLRSVRLDPDRGSKDEAPLYITVCALPCPAGPPRLTGTISTGPDIAMDRLALDAQILETMLGARTREDELRHETEAMLMGLRALLSPVPFREKLDQLAQHLANAIGGDVIDMIQLRPGEKPRLLLSSATLAPTKATALQRVLAAAAGRDVTVLPANSDESAVTCATFEAQAGDMALIAIPYQAEQFYLVCRARRAFNTRDVRLAERFSLLLRQALILRDDQDRMIHTAKLSALGQMSANIAHELRQPLNTISIAAQNIEMLIERNAATPQILKEKVDRVLQQVDRACKVMDRMRRFGRKSAGNYKSVPLGQVVHSAAALMQRGAEKAGIRLDIHVPDDLVVIADELEIEQVLVNLIQNAIDAITDGPRAEPQGWIRLWSSIDPGDHDVACLHVEDNGPGFSPEVLQFAMDAFFTTKEQGKGTGLGLSISHAILREHGGRLQIGNAAQGGLVTLYLRRPPKGDTNVIYMDRRQLAVGVRREASPASDAKSTQSQSKEDKQ